jgi:hypothetical protein
VLYVILVYVHSMETIPSCDTVATLRLITDVDLKDAGLNFAHIAQVRDAYERWMDEVSVDVGVPRA